MNPIHELSELIAELPGIGPRQAKRTVYYLLTQQKGFLERLSSAISRLQDGVQICASCFRFFQKSGDLALCSICRDPHRNRAELMVVSRDIDLENMEKAKTFDGLYFVLGGTVPILEKEPEKKIRKSELVRVMRDRAEKGELKEVIFALNANPEGENTLEYVRRLIAPLVNAYGLKTSTLGRGLSTGSELEYSDSETLRNALKNRR